jgi:signal transduction histidine kinase
MEAQFERPRNVHAVIASAAGVTLLVAGALGWLGWRLLSQEEALEQQRRRDRLEQMADGLVTGFLRTLAEAEAALTQTGSAPHWTVPEPNHGAVAVLLRPTAVDMKPKHALVYVPVLPPRQSIDDGVFGKADELEFRAKDYAGAEAALRTLTSNANEHVRSEALLRLARVQAKSGGVPEALQTYNSLRSEDRLSSAEVPYALLARLERSKLLSAANRRSSTDAEAADLQAALQSGRWPLSKDAYAYYSAAARAVAPGASEGTTNAEKLSVAEAVESIWAEWQSSERHLPRSPARRVYRYGNSPVLVLEHATPERVAAFLYPKSAIEELASAAGWNRATSNGVLASLLDERGAALFGASQKTAIGASRSLAAAQIPWEIRVTASAEATSNGILTGERQFFILGLMTIVGIVALACYALTRGVIREFDAARLQSDFVSAVSHEFRSPLTTLCQLTELLAQGRIQDENRRRLYFDVLQKETGRLHALVENLLDFGRMEAGRRQYSLERVDLYDLVHGAVQDYREEIIGLGYALEFSGSPGTTVHGDRQSLGRVIRNLLENAVKYSPDSRTVWIECGNEDGRAVLRVRDRGMGIAQQEQARVFDKFVRGQAAKAACIQGTGIGLAMVSEIVKAHDGEVHLASELGQGSTFTVRLPLNGTGNGSGR